MIKQFTSHLPEITGQNPASQKFLLAVSGGVDSMVMAYLFKEAGYQFAIAHCNFQLRGEESDADAAFVKETATKLNVPFFEQSFDTLQYKAEKNMSIQMAARELRYHWFHFLKRMGQFDWVATAHHANDRFESALLNFMHGGSPFSLAGVRPVNLYIVRPLLYFSRDEIVAYAKTNHISWREDSSNEKSDYKRNALRNEVLPHLYQWHPTWQKAFERTIKKTEDETAFRTWAVNEFKKQFVEQNKGELRIAIAGLQALENGTAILYELLEGFGFSYDHCDAIAKSDLSRVGNQFENEYARLVVDRQFLIINFKVAEPQKFPLIQQASGVHAVSNQLLALKLVRKAEVVFSPNRAYFDADLLPFPLTWRNWQAGDRFQPFGLEGTKNVSDYLIDLKIPLVEKDKQTVLLTEDKIIWLVGKRQSEHFRLSEQTKMAVEINFTLIND